MLMHDIYVVLVLLGLAVSVSAQCSTCGFGGSKDFNQVVACSALWHSETIDNSSRWTCCDLSYTSDTYCSPKMSVNSDFAAVMDSTLDLYCKISGDLALRPCNSTTYIPRFIAKPTTLHICYDSILPNPVKTDLVATRTTQICKLSVALSVVSIVVPVMAIFCFVGLFIFTRMHIARKKTGRI